MPPAVTTTTTIITSCGPQLNLQVFHQVKKTTARSGDTLEEVDVVVVASTVLVLVAFLMVLKSPKWELNSGKTPRN